MFNNPDDKLLCTSLYSHNISMVSIAMLLFGISMATTVSIVPILPSKAFLGLSQKFLLFPLYRRLQLPLHPRLLLLVLMWDLQR